MKALQNLLVVALFLSANVWAAEVDQSCDAPPDGLVRVKNVAGSVSVQGWDSNQVHVKGTLGSDVERLDFVCSAKVVTIEVVVPKSHNRNIESDLTVSVPKGSSLTVETVSADMRVDGVGGAVTATTVSGGVSLKQAAAPVEAQTVSGDISISADCPAVTAKTISGKVTLSGTIGAVKAESVSGTMDFSGTVKRVAANTISGDIKIAGAADEVKLETVSGRVSASRVSQQAEASTVSGAIGISGDRLTAAEFSTASGNVEFTGDLAEKGLLKVSTHSGRINVHVPEPPAARFDVRTLSGAIKNEFGPPPQRTDEHGPGLELRFGPEQATALVTLESDSGGITIQRYSPSGNP